MSLGHADLEGYKLANARKRAERALEINPKLAAAYVLLADVDISDEKFSEARDAARKAVAENPKDQAALARLAATARLLMDPAGATAAETAALADNPRPADFYAALAERLADRRKYRSAERAFLLAAQADPKRADVKIGLGMLYMQIGREPEARDLFAAAFDADPFNVRADNMMKVLNHMAGYQSVNSAHYVVMATPDDMLNAKYFARYLESIYDELAKRFGYTLPTSTQIEVMKDHEWFSGRTVALPFIPTVGACTGRVVAMSSPKNSRSPFNWARVLKHELTHVITLQQTDFNIPHWYTEALAVESEGFPRPQAWNTMLMERVPGRKKLLNLDTINLGFIRPSEPEDRQLAYAQAQLYAQYMVKRFGADANIKMLNAYRRGLTTVPAIKACFGVEKADFEAKYLEFLDETVKAIRTNTNEKEKPAEKTTFSKLAASLKAKPDDPELNAQMAYELYARGELKEARPYADKALKAKAHHPLASYVKARMLASIGDEDAALEALKPALNKDKPDEKVLGLLAELQLKAGNLDEAEALYRMGRKDDPYHSRWIKGLARIHLRRKQEDNLLGDLEALAFNDSDDAEVRENLAKRALEVGKPEKAEQWAMQCLYIDVYNPNYHALLADAQMARKRPDAAIGEYEVALTLKPRKADAIRVKLAKAQADSGDKAAAVATLDAILKRDPEHPEAKALRDELK